jgi:hypothetical protein
VSINTGLTEAVLDRFAGRLAAALEEAPLCAAASS